MYTKKTFSAMVLSCIALHSTHAQAAESAADAVTSQAAQTQPTFESKVNNYETILQGAVIGAGIGAGLSLLADPHDGKKAAKAAGIGATVGGLLGAGVAKMQNTFASREAKLNQLTADSQKQKDALEEIVSTANTLLADDQAKVTELKQRIASAKGKARKDADELKSQEVKQMQQDLALYDRAIAASDKRLADSRLALADFKQKYKDQDSPGVVAVASNVEAFGNKNEQLKLVRKQHATLLVSLDAPAT